ncbi:ABC transporter permease, partial [Gemella sp. GH3]|uniref:ABC transporter permease n=1 Tax=unclassified Gemella TaxID=2624949 RepID=UPI0015D06272
MDNIKEIFNYRIHQEKEKRSRYNKYIFNSHLVMFLLITVGAVIFNYSKWLESASPFQLMVVITLVFVCLAYILTVTKLKIFILEADSIFLLPLEKKYIEIKYKIIIPIIIRKIVLILLFSSIVYPMITKLNVGIIYNISFLVSMIISSILVTVI